MCSLRALSVGHVAMAKGKPSGVASSFEEDCCVLTVSWSLKMIKSEEGMMSLISVSEERGCSKLHAT